MNRVITLHEPNLIMFCTFFSQGERVFFIVTNYIETPNQTLSFCPEVHNRVLYCSIQLE